MKEKTIQGYEEAINAYKRLVIALEEQIVMKDSELMRLWRLIPQKKKE